MENQTTLPFPLDIQFFAKEDDPNEDEDENDSDQIDDSEIEDEEDEGGKEQDDSTAKEGDDGKSNAQSRKENAYFAQKRREAEKAAKEKAEKENQEKERKKAFVEGKIAGLGGKNPYTEEKIETEYDLHIYEVMKSLDEKGVDPVKGLAKALSEERKAEQSKAEEAEKAKKDAVDLAVKNIAELEKAYPKADKEWFKKAYEEDKKFRSMCDHGYSPKEAYEFLEYDKGEEDEETKRKTPGSQSSGQKAEKSVLDMSDEEFLKFRAKKYGY